MESKKNPNQIQTASSELESIGRRIRRVKAKDMGYSEITEVIQFDKVEIFNDLLDLIKIGSVHAET